MGEEIAGEEALLKSPDLIREADCLDSELPMVVTNTRYVLEKIGSYSSSSQGREGTPLAFINYMRSGARTVLMIQLQVRE